jgi:hypothetical protein
MKTKVGFIVVLAALLLGSTAEASLFNWKPFTTTYFFNDCDGFSSTGHNRYFVLEPGFKIVIEGKQGGHTVRSALTVLDETKTIDGIETRIVEDNETSDGAQTEVSRNHFAICNKTNSVFYFGEDVDTYKNGQIVGHDGAWEAGQNGAQAGLEMPGIIMLGARYNMEVAPGIAEDRSEIISMTETVTTPAGTFENCLKVRETSSIEVGFSYKYYAPGIGLVKDGPLVATQYTK